MNDETVEFVVENEGERLDKLLVARLTDLSRMQVQALINDGFVTVDGARVKPGIKLKGGEAISVTLPQDDEASIEPEDIPLQVVYEDESIAVIDKPAGMVIHPGVGNETGTLVHAIISRWPEIVSMDDPDERLGIVHRLDKDTSGLLVIAKTGSALQNLMAQFQAHTVDKTYIALVERAPKTYTGHIEAPIARDPNQRKRMAVQRNGKAAITEFEVIDDHFKDGQALLKVKLLTGRTHQIRVHMAFIGCPVVGDRVYGFRKQRLKLKRVFLHAAELCFDHPVTGERVCFETPLPGGLKNVLDKMRI
jgi:23S rRNA pseudouridine1911/1915/1917 synthase